MDGADSEELECKPCRKYWDMRSQMEHSEKQNWSISIFTAVRAEAYEDSEQFAAFVAVTFGACRSRAVT